MIKKTLLLIGILAVLVSGVYAQSQPSYLQATSVRLSLTQTTTGWAATTVASYLYAVTFSNVTHGVTVEIWDSTTYAAATISGRALKIGEAKLTAAKNVFKPAIGNQVLSDAAASPGDGILVPIRCTRGIFIKAPSDTLGETLDVTVYYRVY